MKVEINPLNRIIIFCSETPKEFTSDLSPDKSKITIKLYNSKSVESSREIHGQGIVQDVYIQDFKNFVQVSINLKDKRGYNAIPLPFSQALMIEVFDWNKIERAEDEYRSGLLAYEDKIFVAAKKFFTNAALNGNPNAFALLGIMQLQEGNITKAKENLLLAERKGVSIPDAYAALSQIYKINKDAAKSEEYKKLFSEKSGLSTFIDLPTNLIPVVESSKIDTISFLSRIFEPTQGDSASEKALDSLKIQRGADSLSSKKSNTGVIKTGKTEKIPSEAQDYSFLWKVLTYSGVFIAIIGLMVISLYFKWRKQRLLTTSPKTKSKFGENLKNAQSSGMSGSKASNLYKQVDHTVDSEADEVTKTPFAEPPIIQNPKDKSSQSILQLAKEMIAVKSVEDTPPLKKSTTIGDLDMIGESSDSYKPKPQISGKLELAMHLQQEQQRIKTRKIENLKDFDIPIDEHKLSEVAKRLGLEKSSLETKQMISKLEKDEKSLSKLSEKFFVKKDSKKKK